MMNRKIMILLWAVLLTSCDVVNSEFQVPSGSEGFGQKPTCNFKPANNCWQKSINVLMSCMNEDAVGDITNFSNDLAFCENDERTKKIIFDNKLDLYKDNQALIDRNMGFTAYKGDKDCFSFSYKNKNSDFIFTTAFGRLSFESLDNGDKLVHCLDGTEFVVPQAALESGCSGFSGKAVSHIPGVRFTPFSNDQGDGWSFQFLGLSQALGLFQCYE